MLKRDPEHVAFVDGRFWGTTDMPGQKADVLSDVNDPMYGPAVRCKRKR